MDDSQMFVYTLCMRMIYVCWFIDVRNGFICRPLIVVGGSCDQDQENMGGFQEYPQVNASSPQTEATVVDKVLWPRKETMRGFEEYVLFRYLAITN